MHDLVLDRLVPSLEDPVVIQEEPALEIAIPQVFVQPPLAMVQRGRLPNIQAWIEKFQQLHAQQNGATSLGSEYQVFVNEFQPLFTWSIACWDYLLSTEGCRFVLRGGDDRFATRGDYRAVTDVDYSRLVHRVFRRCVFEFAASPATPSFGSYLRAHFWEAVQHAYCALSEPADTRQRTLTPYSYLRCVPYQFLNDFHHHLVMQRLARLPGPDHDAISYYFLNFFTLQAAADVLQSSVDAVEEVLRRSLVSLLVEDRLVYCLLRQIERY